MLRSIKTSERNRTAVTELTSRLGFGVENLIARIALAYSLAQDRRLDLVGMEDSKGKEYSAGVLFGEHLPMYVALVAQHYGLHKAHPDVPKYIKMHIDDGLHLIADIVRESPNLVLMDFVLDQVDVGLQQLSGGQ